MPAVSISPVYNQVQYLNFNGTPLNGGMIYTYESGGNIQQITYNDYSGNTPNTNPIRLDSSGRPNTQIWLISGESYTITLTDSNGTIISTQDNVIGNTAVDTQSLSIVLNESRYFDNNGKALSNGKIFTYQNGSNSIPLTTYGTSDTSQPNTNPVLLNANGVQANPIWLAANEEYNLVLTDSNNIILAQMNGISNSTTYVPPTPPVIDITAFTFTEYTGETFIVQESPYGAPSYPGIPYTWNPTTDEQFVLNPGETITVQLTMSGYTSPVVGTSYTTTDGEYQITAVNQSGDLYNFTISNIAGDATALTEDLTFTVTDSLGGVGTYTVTVIDIFS